jgi:hypothetical protein
LKNGRRESETDGNQSKRMLETAKPKDKENPAAAPHVWRSSTYRRVSHRSRRRLETRFFAIALFHFFACQSKQRLIGRNAA